MSNTTFEVDDLPDIDENTEEIYNLLLARINHVDAGKIFITQTNYDNNKGE